ncbi:hypothetical protein AKJ09_02353 [Labilithrix luteola]|uniref:BNR repeat domain protein n=1 Tax=Labilithrix luteola TaxID=1391654 RepID=A0A0K1PRE9_9BACT|nr:hypothetical protein [Labilithrix luteola]AKU95689.1 hypothetical protein AKJ09_02353 [Labilithrix luteola]
MTRAGSLHCWGSGYYGALGGGGAMLPGRITLHGRDGALPQQISVAESVTCVRLTDGTVQCTGMNFQGQLGLGAPDGGTTVEMVGAFTPAVGVTGYVTQVSVGTVAVCALLKTGEVACWGSNAWGQLGAGTSDGDAHPTPVSIPLQP